jgi:hypothetical protein
MKKVKFKPGDAQYRREAESESPFSKRNQVLFTHDAKTKAKFVTVRDRYYELFFVNEKESYRSRNHFFKPGESIPALQSGYLQEEALVGNARQIAFSMSKFIKRILVRLEEDPQSLFTEASMIRRVCLEEALPIPKFDAFDRIESWDAFIKLLNSIADSNDTHKFELLLAAIDQYATLCS